MKKIKNKIVAFVKGDESNGRIKWSLYGRVWREIGRPYWKWLAAGIVFTILAAGAEAYTITIVQQVVDKAFIEKSLTAIYWLGVQVIVAFGAKGAFTYAKALIMAKGGLLASANLQKKIYKHMTHMNLARFYSDGIGKNLNYFGVQAGAVLNLVTGTVIRVVQNVATLIMTLALMFYYAPQMCVVLMFLAPAIMIPMVVIMRKRRKLSRQSFGIANNVSQQLNQTLHGIKTIQAFAAEEREDSSVIIPILYKSIPVANNKNITATWFVSIPASSILDSFLLRCSSIIDYPLITHPSLRLLYFFQNLCYNLAAHRLKGELYAITERPDYSVKLYQYPVTR